MSSGQKCTNAQEQARNAREVFCDTLSLFVGPGRRFEADAIGAATGITADTIRRYLRRESCPEWANAIALLRVLPPEFAASVLRPAGLTGLRRIDGSSPPGETLREMAEGVAELAKAWPMAGSTIPKSRTCAGK